MAHPRPRGHRQPGYDGRGGATPITEEVDCSIDPSRAIDGEHEHPPRSARSVAQPEQSLHGFLHSSTASGASAVAASASAVPHRER
jgi:hypothetical protein